MTFPRSRCLVPAVIVLALYLPSAGADDKEPAAAPLERFRKEDAAARLRLVEKLPRSAEEFHKATIGSVISTLVERGSVESAEVSDVVCRLKAHTKGSPIVSTIKWVIDDGTVVKKGERLIELDDFPIREQIAAQKIALDKAIGDKVHAEETIKVLRKSNDLDGRLGEIAVRLAELELKKDNGTDKERREILELRLEKARLELERTKTLAKAKENEAEADFRSKRAVAELEAVRLDELEEELKQCVLTAPHDGLATYFVPEPNRSGPATPLIAQGEPVKEGQRLLRVADLKRFQVNLRVAEPIAALGQKVSVQIDAFPNRKFSGKVTVIAAAPHKSGDIKGFPMVVSLTDEVSGLKPGLSAAVTFPPCQRDKVVQVPASAVVRVGQKPSCFVKTAKGIEERQVTIGLSGNRAVEIKEGLKEGDQVLRDVRAVLGRLYPGPKRDDNGLGALRPTEILLRSVKPDDAGDKGRSVLTYGLTADDLERILTIPTVTEVVPARVFPSEVYRLDKMHLAKVIATVPAFADAAGLKMTAGRFLSAKDDEKRENVVVLGSAVAEALFPFDDPLEETILIGKFVYKVVGVVGEKEKGAMGLLAHQLNQAVYVPLKTSRLRFGERTFIREGGSRRAEQVFLDIILLRTSNPDEVRAAAEVVRTLLENNHKTKDWVLVTPDGR